VAALRTGVSLFGKALPVTISWAGADTGGSGVARYELQKSLSFGHDDHDDRYNDHDDRHDGHDRDDDDDDHDAKWWTVSSTLTAPTTNLTVSTSGSIVFRVRAVDKAGNIGAWAVGSVLTPRLVQDSSKSISYKGSWSKSKSDRYSGGSVRSSRQDGATATIRTSGKSFAFVTTKSEKAGWVRIYVNGTLQARVNLASANTQYRALAWQTSWASATAPTIKIVVESPGRTRVDLDAFAILK
jgi:hypothetical protein